MRLTSAGAARTVTGSCHHLDLGDFQLVVDCGLFQGGAELEDLNRAPFPFEPRDLGAVLVTHGHLDHVGRLPLLVKAGYAGRFLATKATADVAAIILRDAAKLQEEDFERDLRKARRAGRESELLGPLYTLADVEAAIARFQNVALHEPVRVAEGVTATFRPAGHILGSAYIELRTREARVVFSGDLGNRESSIQAPAEPPGGCDVLVIESTYADQTHPTRAETEARFQVALGRSLGKGGNVMIPTFAAERAQQVLYLVNRLMSAGQVPRLPVFLDSPMAAKMTRLYQECACDFRPEIADLIDAGQDPFEPPTLRYAVTADESKAINEVTGGAVVIAGSGMLTGGRIRHHLKHNLWREEATLIVVGYQAHGTLGRLLLEGAKRVKLFGEEVVVRATIENIKGFSAHADHDDLLAFMTPTGATHVLLVHGEPEVMDGFAAELRRSGRRVSLPEFGVPTDL